MSRVVVHFACNDYRNGVFESVCGGVAIYSDVRCEEDASWTGYDLDMEWDGDVVVLEGEKFAVHGRSHWVGNWCWDGTTMDPPEAERLVAHLIKTLGGPDMWCPDTPFGRLVEAAVHPAQEASTSPRG